MKHTLTFFLPFIILAIAFSSCEEKEEIRTGNLELVFKGTFGNEPLYMFGRSYDYRGDAAVKWHPIWNSSDQGVA